MGELAFNFWELLGEEPPPPPPPKPRYVEPLERSVSDMAFEPTKELLEAYEEMRCAVYNFCMAWMTNNTSQVKWFYESLVRSHDKVVEKQERVSGRDRNTT